MEEGLRVLEGTLEYTPGELIEPPKWNLVIRKV